MCLTRQETLDLSNLFWCLQNRPDWAVEIIKRKMIINLNRQVSEIAPFFNVIRLKNGTIISCAKSDAHPCAKCILAASCALKQAHLEAL